MINFSFILVLCIAGIGTVPIHDSNEVIAIHRDVNLDICTECQQILGTIHLFISNNASEAAILSAMSEMCSYLPQSIKGYCTEIVSTFGKQMIAELVNYLADPSKFCSLIGMCNSTDTMVAMKFRNLLMKRRLLGNNRINLVGGISKCELCEFIMAIVKQILEDKPVETFVRQEFVKLCSYLPPTTAGECKALVNTFELKGYIAIIKNFVAPMKFCPDIGIC